ncbi:MAG: 5'-nucleotidase C-terminal domain-containing protein [Gracilibacteraceae bacterium]|nr:5'-nucleotidase C-terminal domain-containing protein [Gracilibacteraceae bacterium]
MPGITILHTNDVHGSYSAVDAYTGEPSKDIIGHDTIAAVYEAFQKEEGPVFLLDAGDATQGVYFVTQNEGQAAIEIMNAAGMTLGNHEFDYGWFRLLQLIGAADFPILSQIADEESAQTDNLLHYTVIERGGVRLGVFGITTPETQFKSNGGFGRDFGTADSIVTYARDMARTLREEEGADYVVCLAHLGVEDMGFGTGYDIRDNAEGIDLIIDGHSHTVLADIENIERMTQITSAGAYGKNLGVARLSRNEGELVTELELMDKAACEKYTPQAKVTAVIQKWSGEVAQEGKMVVAQVPFDITIARENERTRETVMGDILTDAMRAVSGADIAMQNGGSIRDQELAAGDVTKAQLITILPYGNVLQMAEVRGSAVLECLEQSVSMYPEANGGFIQVSGLEFSFDPAQPPGRRVSAVRVGDEELEPDKVYTLCTNDFVAAGGDLYTMLIEPFSAQLQLMRPEYMAIENALIWYLEENQDALPSQTQGRIFVTE